MTFQGPIFLTARDLRGPYCGQYCLCCDAGNIEPLDNFWSRRFHFRSRRFHCNTIFFASIKGSSVVMNCPKKVTVSRSNEQERICEKNILKINWDILRVYPKYPKYWFTEISFFPHALVIEGIKLVPFVCVSVYVFVCVSIMFLFHFCIIFKVHLTMSQDYQKVSVMYKAPSTQNGGQFPAFTNRMISIKIVWDIFNIISTVLSRTNAH